MSRDVSTFSPGDTTFVQEVEEGAAARGWVAGRYEIGALLGRGGSGQVHRAHDHLVGEDVAIKFVSRRGPVARRLVRRELTALRLLDLPGVVGLRDDGWLEGDQIFIVMDLLEGGSFDSAAGPWHAWAEAAQHFLEALARVHFAGVLHRDLKPNNVLLDGAGQPVITDFGLAQGAAVEDPEQGYREGTPRFMAPEQARGEPCDERTDLYSVGVMFAEMLGDHDAPPVVHEVIAAMQAPTPSERPGSVAEVLGALGVGTEALLGSVEGMPEVASREDLRALFAEPAVSFLHVAQDAVELLLRRTGGRRGRVADELLRWTRSGRIRWSDGRVVMERAALDQIAWSDDPDLKALLDTSLPDGALGERLLERARSLHVAGQSARALGVVDAAAPLLGDTTSARGALELLATVALAVGRQAAVRQAMVRCERAGALDLRAMLHGASLSWGGDRRRAIDLLCIPVAGETDGPELGRIAHLVQACAAVDRDRLPKVLKDADQRCADEVSRGRWWIWKAQSHYANGEFGAALEANREALGRLAAAPALQLAAIMNAGNAALEAGETEQAVAYALRGGELAARLRNPVGECRAVILRRHAAYRARQPMALRPDLVTAARAVSRRLGLEMAVSEALVGQRTPSAASLARLAAELARDGDGILGTLAAALGCAWAAGAPPLDEAIERLPASLRLQVEALLVGQRAPPDPGELEQWLRAWPFDVGSARREIFSVDECVARLQGSQIS